LEDFKKKLEEDLDKEEENQIIIYRILELEKEKKDIKNMLININSIKNKFRDQSLPFILFLIQENIEELKRKIDNIIYEEKLEKLDKRFMLLCQFSGNEKELNLIEKKIYRAFSYYNESGDIFNLNEIEIDLREQKFDVYFNIICIARSQQGKSSFINKFISSFKNEDDEIIKAKEGGNERACSTKIAKYYINNFPIRLIDIIGYDGEADTINKLKHIVQEMSILILNNEIHIILYIIEYNSSNLFLKQEVEIFETLKLNILKPKLLFIRTKSPINIYKKENENIIYDIEGLNKRKKESIETKIFNMNKNFKKIKEDKDGIWTKVINFLFGNDMNRIFSLDNVCFINLFIIEDDSGNLDILPFGLDYVKNKIFKLLKEIYDEENKRIKKWVELRSDLINNKNIDYKKILDDMSYFNISTGNLSREIKSLIDQKAEKNLTINFRKMPKIITPFLCKKCQKYHLGIFILGIGLIKDQENGHLNLTVNSEFFHLIFENFIDYKIQCISSIEYYLFQQNKINQDSEINENDNKDKGIINNDINNDINSDSNSINSATTGINDMKKSENIESSKVNNDISLNNESVNIYDNNALNTKKKKKKKKN